MKSLSLIALAVLAFEQDLCSVVSDLQVETLEMVEQFADGGELSPSNGSHG